MNRIEYIIYILEEANNLFKNISFLTDWANLSWI